MQLSSLNLLKATEKIRSLKLFFFDLLYLDRYILKKVDLSLFGGNIKMPLKDFKDSPIAKDLQDLEFASSYLEDALREGMTDFIIALRNVTDANGGVGKLSEISNLARESLYKTLPQSGESSPYFSTIQQILTSLGFELSITPIDVDDDQEAA